MKTQILRKKNDLSLISQTDKTWILNNGRGTNQIAAFSDIKIYSKGQYVIPTKCLTQDDISTNLNKWLDTDKYDFTYNGSFTNINKLVKYQDLEFKKRPTGIAVSYDTVDYTGKIYSDIGIQYSSSGTINNDITPLHGNPIITEASYSATLDNDGSEFISSKEKLYIHLQFTIPYNMDIHNRSYEYNIYLFNTQPYSNPLISINYDIQTGTRVYYEHDIIAKELLYSANNQTISACTIMLVYYQGTLYSVKNGANSNLSDSTTIRLESIDNDTYYKDDLYCIRVGSGENNETGYSGLEVNSAYVNLFTV